MSRWYYKQPDPPHYAEDGDVWEQTDGETTIIGQAVNTVVIA